MKNSTAKLDAEMLLIFFFFLQYFQINREFTSCSLSLMCRIFLTHFIIFYRSRQAATKGFSLVGQALNIDIW